jgi:hypothetical protein
MDRGAIPAAVLCAGCSHDELLCNSEMLFTERSTGICLLNICPPLPDERRGSDPNDILNTMRIQPSLFLPRSRIDPLGLNRSQTAKLFHVATVDSLLPSTKVA